MNRYFNLGLAGLFAVFQNVLFIPKDTFWPQPSLALLFSVCSDFHKMYFLLSSQIITWSHLDNIVLVVQSGHVVADRHSCGHNFAVNLILNLLY